LWVLTGGNTRADVVKAYRALFDSTATLLDKYSLWVEVGDSEEEYEKIFLAKGWVPADLWRKDKESKIYHDCNVDDILELLYEPKIILQNLVFALLEKAEKNKKKIKELQLVMRFVKALSDDNGDDEEEHKN
jgi:hypothetical protein